MADKLHVVIVPSWWPTQEWPGKGVFFQDFVDALSEKERATSPLQVGVVFPDLVGLRHWLRTDAPLRPRITIDKYADCPIVSVRGRFTALGRPQSYMNTWRTWLDRGLKAYASRYGMPDVLHAMCAAPAGWAATTMDSPLSHRVVLTEHTGPFRLLFHPTAQEPLVREAVHRAAAVVSVSEPHRAQMQAEGISRNVLVCGNPVSKVFFTNEVKHRHDVTINATFVGRLVKEKGIEILLAAIGGLADDARVHWHIAGDGPGRREIEKSVAPLQAANRVHLYGWCDRERLATVLQMSDFLYFPTRGESFGLAAAEALCCGVPVVTTRGTACAAFINETNGLLVEPGDAAGFVNAARTMAATARRYDRAAIAKAARERFSPMPCVEFYMSLYARVAAGKECGR